MHNTAQINKVHKDGVLTQLNEFLKGTLNEEWGEHTLEFDNGIGKGTLRSINFDWGVSLIDYDVEFNEEFSITYNIGDVNPLVFFYLSEGCIDYCCDADGEKLSLDRYQNIIISNKKFSTNTIIFPKNVRVKANFIQIIKENYIQKKNHNLTSLDQKLLPIVQNASSNFVYYHIGSYNVKIADALKNLNSENQSGIIRTLSLEAQLNLVLAMQLTEHQNFINKIDLPESLTIADIKKVYKLSDYINNNIADSITIEMLAAESGISPKKLQLGFQTLYSNSINVQVREMKMQKAIEYLTESDLSISEIVYNIGFKSRSYFSKIFNERYGILPTEYRKNLRKSKV